MCMETIMNSLRSRQHIPGGEARHNRGQPDVLPRLAPRPRLRPRRAPRHRRPAHGLRPDHALFPQPQGINQPARF